jgi:GH35 family endo-1,4-beta-xylanase
VLNAGGNPKTPQLVVNDYHVVEGMNNMRRQYTINFVADIRSRTANIHGFGLQSHVGSMFIPMDTLQSRLNRYTSHTSPSRSAIASDSVHSLTFACAWCVCA